MVPRDRMMVYVLVLVFLMALLLALVVVGTLNVGFRGGGIRSPGRVVADALVGSSLLRASLPVQNNEPVADTLPDLLPSPAQIKPDMIYPVVSVNQRLSVFSPDEPGQGLTEEQIRERCTRGQAVDFKCRRIERKCAAVVNSTQDHNRCLAAYGWSGAPPLDV